MFRRRKNEWLKPAKTEDKFFNLEDAAEEKIRDSNNPENKIIKLLKRKLSKLFPI